MRLLFVGVPFLQQFTAYVIPTHRSSKYCVGLKSKTACCSNRKKIYALASQINNEDNGSSTDQSSSTMQSYPYSPLEAPTENCDDNMEQPQQQDPFQAGFQLEGEKKLIKTFGGGTTLMFKMIRERMLDWGSSAEPQPSKPKTLPKWHPHTGISDVNPNFRQAPPAMNNRGFAKSIWRNLRKRQKPSLWQNALRTYDRMTAMESETLNIQRSNIHHEGAMLACAKLGDWHRALEIYHSVHQIELETQAQFDDAQFNETRSTQPTPIAEPAVSTLSSAEKRAASIKMKMRREVHVTDSMILSLVRACVKASRNRGKQQNNGEESHELSPELEEQEAALRRIPLDTALEILSNIQEDHNIPLVAVHINPLAAAYQKLGYVQQSLDIVQTMLSNRTVGEEPEDGVDILNVNDFCAKNKDSYSLLVQGSVVTGDWGSAVEALADMTNAGLYPNKRHCNIWSEISERQTRPRAVGSWKKKRDDYWTDSVI